MNNYDHIRQIFSRYMDGSITEAERAELSEAAETYSTKEWEEILEPLLSSFRADAGFNIADWEKEIRYILAQPKEEKKVVRMFIWRKIAVAASIITIIGLGVFVISKRNGKSPATAETRTKDIPAPSNTRAVITLADGRKVYLDSVNNGTIAQENNVNVVKNANGEIQYMSPAGGANSEQRTANSPTYNTLSNPRGSKVISLTLSDGTKVWLNSESSLKYPIAFAGNTREIEITGEAYFEVKHNAQQPFKVHLPNGSIVEDIGTSFNINAYSDEADIRTTLIEGSVRVATTRGPVNGDPRKTPGVDQGVVLKPGQQAVVSHNSQLITRNSPDLEEVLAWKNGLFSFNSAGLNTVMRQVARWYDVDVVYADKIQINFTGEMKRNTSLSEMLRAIQLTAKVKFSIEGKRVIVSK